MSQTKIILSFLTLSLIGGILLIVYVSLTPAASYPTGLIDRVIVAGVFITICIFGISFALRPNWIRLLITKKDEKINHPHNGMYRSFRGHHPDCKSFDAHRITPLKKTWCSGCLGLLIGCLLSILVMILYVLFPFSQTQFTLRLMLFLGLIIIIFVFLEIVQTKQHSIIHILSNSILILSFSMITVGILELSGKIEYGFYTILLCILWLDTRIRISKWHHIRLCKSCKKPCKMYISIIIF